MKIITAFVAGDVQAAVAEINKHKWAGEVVAVVPATIRDTMQITAKYGADKIIHGHYILMRVTDNAAREFEKAKTK